MLLTILFCTISSYGQSPLLKQYGQYVNDRDIQNAVIAKAAVDTKKLGVAESALYHYITANLYQLENRDNLAFHHYILSKGQFQELDSLDKVAEINIQLVSLLLAINKAPVDYREYLEDYIAYAQQKDNPACLSKAYMEAGKSFYSSDPKLSLDYFKKALAENGKTTDVLYRAKIYQNLGATYASDKINKPDAALGVYKKALLIYQKLQLKSPIFYIYTNMGVAYTKKKEYDKAIYFFSRADSIPLNEFKAKNKKTLYGFFSNAYKDKGDYKSALEYTEKEKVYDLILDENEQTKAIKDIDTKYKTREKETENLNLKSSIRTNRLIVYTTIGLLLLLLIISSLTYKNISKKKKIAEQEQLISIQQLDKVLKEQELHEIDLMLESQEKERKRIANELHDNLGSMLATLKLNFQSLKRRNGDLDSNEQQLYEKTDRLIEEAYQEVRSISHLKNLGVVASEGLLTAVNKMAEKMSVPGKLHISVIPFGLNERLENSMEVTIFRMIQELCTNIIKHSEATEVNIYLNQHAADEINIMIEDNGKGFEPKAIVAKQGMGLRSIETKTEYLGGTFTIDSIVSRGTTIIINLPL